MAKRKKPVTKKKKPAVKKPAAKKPPAKKRRTRKGFTRTEDGRYTAVEKGSRIFISEQAFKKLSK